MNECEGSVRLWRGSLKQLEWNSDYVSSHGFWTFYFTNWTSTLRYVGLFLEASAGFVSLAQLKKKKKRLQKLRERSRHCYGWTEGRHWAPRRLFEDERWCRDETRRFQGIYLWSEMNRWRAGKQRRSRRTRSNIIINITINPKRSADRIYKNTKLQKKKKTAVVTMVV